MTGKPAELAVRAIQYSSVRGENALDLFGGSGSTMIGCEQTGRTGFLLEIDPPYCDVIVDRYQRFSGTSGILERTGESPIAMKPREENMRCRRCEWLRPVETEFYVYPGRNGVMGLCRRCQVDVSTESKRRRRQKREDS